MSATRKTLLIIGLLCLSPILVSLIGWTLGYVLQCDIEMAGLVESVTCEIGGSAIGSIIGLLINLMIFGMVTTIPGMILLGIVFFSKPMDPAVTTPQERSRHRVLKIVVAAVAILFLFGGLIRSIFQALFDLF